MAHRRFWNLALFLLVFLAAVGMRAAVAGEDQKININTANASELMSLHRVGQATAQRIIAYRNEHGPFKSVEDLVAVRGIGPRVLDGFRSKITVGESGRAGKSSRPKPSS